ncbi:uncharacterized protein LOC128715179 [Anopheles marshallii]|uniref:uncharacterized protein LOC128715179 n=1 Tax=Anopheles marshallii TaxID=1521116 RepID=UPI00237C2D80|nr:uncharacterized protein LOC128715179 [Anopheles marshallii]
MEDAARLEAKQIISQYMASYSVSQLTDVSFSEREHLAELHKQIELRKTYRDSLRSLNLGLYALKQGMCRYGSDAFGEQLAEDYHSTIRQVVEKQQETSQGLQQLCYEYTMLGNSRQALIEQAELQKLQGVLRLQEQVRAKLAGTRVVKLWEREKATLLSEQKDMSKLEAAGKEIMKKRGEMLERKHDEIANTLICIGEGLEKAEELRMKLTEITKQYRDELHDDQSSDADLRSEDGKKDAGAGENDRDTNSAPMFDSIDWNLGSVSMDLRLDLNFKNPNDFPDILTHLSTINTSKYQLKDVKQHNVGKCGKQSAQNADVLKKSSQKGNEEGSCNTPFSGYSCDVPTATKRSKLNDVTEKVVQQVVSNDVEKAPAHENREKYKQRVILATPKPLQKQSNENVANLQHKASRKKPSMTAQHETGRKESPTLEKKAAPTTAVGQQDGKKGQEMNTGSSQSRFRTPANRAIGNIAGIVSNPLKNKREPQSVMQQQYQQRGQLEKKHVEQQKQPEPPKRTRSMKLLSPASTNQPKPVGHKPPADSNEPTPMEVDSDGDTQDEESSTSNNSLDFGMQSGSCEFDMNFSDDLRPEPEAIVDDALDFLSMNPGRITRSKGQKKKPSSGKSTGSGDDMDTFDFTFGRSNSSESLEQPEDLF